MKRTPLQAILLYCFVVAICAFLVFPIYWLFITSISQPDQLRKFPPDLLPDNPNWGIFPRLLVEKDLLLWLYNSSLAAIAAVILSMLVAIPAGFSLSRYPVRGGNSIGLFILMAKMLPPTLLVIPLFAIFRQLHLIGSLWSIILAHATLIVPFSTWMLKGYFDTIPRELEQAAMVDGCSPLGAMIRVTLPAAAPGLAATALYGFVLSWADYAFARTFLTNAQSNWTANVGIATMKGEYITDWNEIMAASLMTAVPIILVYLFLERYLVGGLTAGAEK